MMTLGKRLGYDTTTARAVLGGTIWINPEPRELWGTGDSDMLEYEPLCNQVMLVRNLAELTKAVDHLLA